MRNVLLVVPFVLVTSTLLAQSFNWVKQIHATSPSLSQVFIESMVTDASGNIYVVGEFSGTIDFDPGPGSVLAGPSVGTDVWFGKYSSTGALIWAKAIIGGDDDWANDIVLDASSPQNVYITGHFYKSHPLDFDPGTGVASPVASSGFFLAKYNNSGTYQWLVDVGPPTGNAQSLDSYAIGFDPTYSGTIYIAGGIGYLGFPGQSYDFDPRSGPSYYWPLSTSDGSVFVARYTLSGIYLNAMIMGPANSSVSFAKDLAVEASGNVHSIYITGKFNGSAEFDPNPYNSPPLLASSNGSVFAAKINNLGNLVWQGQVSGIGTEEANAIGIDANSNSNVFITGQKAANGGNMILARLNSGGTQTHLLDIGGSGGREVGQALRVDGTGVYVGGTFYQSVNFNPGGSYVLTANFQDMFLAKYNTSNLSFSWARALDLSLANLADEMNAIRISSGKVLAAGNFQGTGDFSSCGTLSVYNATSLDGFLLGYTVSDPPMTVAGPDLMCSPGQMSFSAYNVPQGATVSWSVSPSSWVSASTGAGPTFVTNLLPGFGPGTLSVTASGGGPCAGPAYKIIQVGVPAAICEPTVWAVEPCYTLDVSTCTGGLSSYDWYIDGTYWATTPTDHPGLSLIGVPGGNHSVCVGVSNGCGSSELACAPFYNPCNGGGGMQAFPNPAKDHINVKVDKNENQGYSYVVKDKSGNVVMQGYTQDPNMSLDTSGLKPDVYYLETNVNGKKNVKRVVIGR